jgi:NitT/TauT family transport system substrate-binding protein
MRTHSVGWAFLIILLLVFVAACGGDQDVAPPEPVDDPPAEAEAPAEPGPVELEITDIRLVTIPISVTMPLLVAEEEGFFEEAGLNVTIERVGGGAEAVPLLAGGHADVIASDTVSTLQMISEGLDVVMLVPYGGATDSPPDSTSSVLVLATSDIETAADLEGRRVAVNVVGSLAWLYFSAWMEENGGDPGSVVFQEVPFPQQVDLLLGGQVDAIFPAEPFRTIAQRRAEIRILGHGFTDVQPGAQTGHYIALRSWVDEHPEAARRLRDAIAGATDFLLADEAEMRRANVAWTGLDESLAEDVAMPGFTTSVDVDQVEQTMGWMLHFGVLDAPVEVSDHVFDG